MRLLVVITIAAAVAATIVIVQPKITAKEYLQSIERKRGEIDEFMRFSGESPIPVDEMNRFSGLNYYPVDASFRTEADLTTFEDPEIIEVPTSANTLDTYLRYGRLSFKIDGTELTLEVWKPLDGAVSNRLFVAYTDLTSGDETYGGGRYLSLYFDRDDTVTIDFNLAYNPYCVYDPSYICPIAPPENRLPSAIRAGEKN